MAWRGAAARIRGCVQRVGNREGTDDACRTKVPGVSANTERAARRTGIDADEGLFRALFETSPTAIAIVDERRAFVTWNARFTELFSTPEDPHEPEAMRRHIAGQLDDEGAFEEAMDRLAADPGAELDLVVSDRDGRALELRTRSLLGARVFVFDDVSERVALEQELKKREERYRALYNETPAMMHSIDASGRIVSVSDAWLERLGYSRDEVIGRRSVEFLTPESRAYAEEHVLPGFFDSGSCRDVPYRFRTREGEVVDVLLSATAERRVDGMILRSMAVLTDVTELRRLLSERDRAFAELDTIIRKAPVGLAFLDRELRYVRMNERLSQIHGIEPRVAVGKPIGEVTPTIAEHSTAILERVLNEEREIVGVEMTVDSLASPGKKRVFLCDYYPVRTGGEVVGVGVVVVDVTAQKEAAAKEARLRREAQEALQLRDEFLAIAAHELRTPLTPLSLSLQVIEQQVRAKQPVEPWTVQRAMRQLDRLGTLIEELLESSQAQHGMITLHAETFSFTELVDEVLTAMRESKPRHSFERIGTHEPLIVEGDRQRLATVVRSLLDNAVKYSSPEAPIRVSLSRCGRRACLAVEDRGIGIPDEDVERVFERFFRARNAPVTHYGGFGLDLYISANVIRLHGGTITVESRLGEGSTFLVTLPLRDA